MEAAALGAQLSRLLSHPDPSQQAQAAELLLSLGAVAPAVWSAARPTARRATLPWLEQLCALARSLSAPQALALAALILPDAPLGERAAFWLGARGRLRADRFFSAIGSPQREAGLVWVALPGGVFRMGARDPGADSWERPTHAVSLGPFAILEAPVTRTQLSVMAPQRPGGDAPAGTVGWLEAWLFAEWAGAALPTEAQWEHACRAGTDSPWSSGYDPAALGRAAWFADNAGGCPRPVKARAPNPWGLYDMHGNVMEWCADQQRAYHRAAVPIPDPGADAQRAPRALTGAVSRVARGGYYRAAAAQCRSAHRAVFDILSAFDGLGFRLVRATLDGDASC